VDDRGCIVDPAEYGSHLILERHAAELAERLDRPATPSDVTDPMCFGSAILPDLDGDGANDSEVTEGCTWGVHASLHLVYLSNSGCRLFAGEILDGELRPLASKSRGVRDLEANWSNGCAGNDFQWQHYRWNGKAYAVVDKATCEFCPDTPRRANANRHPHCRQELLVRQRDK
jgi:hypothetical protein